MSNEKKKDITPSEQLKSSSKVGLYVNGFEDILPRGYKRLDECPEIVAGVRKIAELVSSMTIQLMQNTENGDVRIENELSKQIDIETCSTMNRKNWLETIVMNMLLYGNGNAIVRPITANGRLADLQPIPSNRFAFIPSSNGYEYKINIDGKEYNPNSLLHFAYNPDPNIPWKGKGITTSIRPLADMLTQGRETEEAFMKSKFKPSLIIKVDAFDEGFNSEEGREKMLNAYVSASEVGKPWILPADMIQVEQIKPLSLNDLAINETVEMDRKMVASILGVPSFLLGCDKYDQEEYNNFVSTKISSIAMIIEQELTRKLLFKPEWHLKLNVQSLLRYDIGTTADVFSSLYDRGIVTGNEVRSRLGLPPLKGLDELLVLENYIPVSQSGKQKKIKDRADDE